MSPPVVAIVGAPNVGKSTLFNRLVGRRTAIVSDEPGVTRDRNYGEVRSGDQAFRLIDTGGLTPSTAAPMAREIERQARLAIAEAAVVLFVVDVRAGVTAIEHEIAELLRRSDVPVVVVGNKADGPRTELLAAELFELGLGEPVAVSAEHGGGIDELLERVAPLLGDARSPSDEPGGSALRVAIVGRPNVGKSSLLNRLVGEERVLVSDVPGTTRDSIDTLLRVGQRSYLLVDTAGIRRAGRVERGVERFSVARARASIERCDVAILVLDASSGLVAQDAHVAGQVLEASKPMVVAVNKWDLPDNREAEAKRWEQLVRERLHFAKEVPLVRVSAKTGQRVARLLAAADRVHEQAGQRVTTGELNRWLQHVAGRDRFRHGRPVRLYYATQTGTRPPTFVVFCNDPARIHFSFRRELENSLRDRYGFGAAPIRMRFRTRRTTPGA